VEGEPRPDDWGLLKDGPALAAVRQIQQQLHWQQQFKQQQDHGEDEAVTGKPGKESTGAAAGQGVQGTEHMDAAENAAEDGNQPTGGADACLQHHHEQQQQLGTTLKVGLMSCGQAAQQTAGPLKQQMDGGSLQQQQQDVGAGSPGGQVARDEASAPKRGTLRLFCGSFRIQGIWLVYKYG
jgi:hypothetical protein